jgi:hypothetical protein
MSDNDIDNELVTLSTNAVLDDLRKKHTMTTLDEEIRLMRIAYTQIDILNLRLGPYTSTALMKIAICIELLKINGDHIEIKKTKKILRLLNKMEKIIQRKLNYGRRLDKYLDKVDGILIERIKSNLLGLDLDQYNSIRTKLLGFKSKLIDITDQIIIELPKHVKVKLPEVIDNSPKLV